ncbi:MAG: RIP metalloprotease RseP [Casimicrobiaceae bacterium]|nr:RIP metalloprotease RseP [Casimicrobiaceae bacterium]
MVFGSSLLGFLLAVAILVTVHEFGHYLAARLCGVRVLRFSVGFGPVLVRWVGRRSLFAGTEFAISAIPLGGYVRMLDSRDTEHPPRDMRELAEAFDRQVLWKRSTIVAAGPLANFLLAAVLYAFALSLPERGAIASLAPPAEDSPAAAAGLRGGERVIAVDGTAVLHWGDVRWHLLMALFQDRLRLTVEVGGIEREFELVRGRTELTDEAATRGRLESWGLQLDQPARIGFVKPGGPGAAAGLKADDLILAIDGRAIAQWSDAAQMIRAAPEQRLRLTVRRATGEQQELVVIPRRELVEGQAIGRIDVGVASPLAPGSQRAIDVQRGLIEAVREGTWRAVDATALTVRLLWGMVMGEVSLRQLSGPLTMAEGAGHTLKQGLSAFVFFLAIVSVSIGVLNLLPVPMLDGGQLLYHAFEAIKGAPLSERAELLGQRIGIGLLTALTLLAIYNDLLRILN